jgi:hypothetical protein
MENKSLCISLSRKGEFPLRLITLLIISTFSTNPSILDYQDIVGVSELQPYSVILPKDLF